MCIYTYTHTRVSLFLCGSARGTANAFASLRTPCEMLPVDLLIKCEYPLLLNPPLMIYEHPPPLFFRRPPLEPRRAGAMPVALLHRGRSSIGIFRGPLNWGPPHYTRTTPTTTATVHVEREGER